jgi:AcrR family transcriptional regulator
MSAIDLDSPTVTPVSDDDGTEVSTEPRPRRTRGGRTPTGTGARRRERVSAAGSARAERTRAELVEASRRVFERDGFFEARIVDIVTEAGLSRGSFYTYFPAKRDAFLAVVDEVRAEVAAAVQPAADDVPGRTLANLELANLRFIRAYRANAAIITLYDDVAMVDEEFRAMRVAGRARHVERVERSIASLQRRGLADPTLDTHTVAGALVAMLRSYVYWSIAADESVDDVSLQRTVTIVWTRALRMSPAQPDAPAGV